MTQIISARYDENRWCATLVWMALIRTYAQLADQLRETGNAVRFVGIDGCGGAGNTTFAERLARHGDGWPLVHTDDFASHDEFFDWWPRLLADVIEPMSQHRPATFRPYDWVNRRPGPPKTIEPADVVIIEGVSATRQAWRDRLACAIWVDTDSDLRLQRGLARDGEALTEFWREWRLAASAHGVLRQGRHVAARQLGEGSTEHDRERRAWDGHGVVEGGRIDRRTNRGARQVCAPLRSEAGERQRRREEEDVVSVAL